MNNSTDYFEELEALLKSNLSVRKKHETLFSLLKRFVNAQTSLLSTDYTGLAAQLYALCKIYQFPLTEIDLIRRRAINIAQKKEKATDALFLFSIQKTAQFIGCITHSPIPVLLNNLSEQPRSINTFHKSSTYKCIRATVVSCNDSFVHIYPVNTLPPNVYTVKLPEENSFTSLPSWQEMLYEGCTINLLSLHLQENILYPDFIVIEPDFLIDVSALAACFKPYGSHPVNYLLDRFKTRSNSPSILLGNAANQFMDDCIYHPTDTDKPVVPIKERYKSSIQKHFRQAMLDYACCRPHIQPSFFKEAEHQFSTIYEAVNKHFLADEIGISIEKVQLEPSFICEALGLRGRMDVLTNDATKLIELKSGKAEWLHGKNYPKEAHSIQMALYKEILYYNLNMPYQKVSAFLFYSHYPLFFDQRGSKRQIQQALMLRNRIVYLELLIRTGKYEQLEAWLDECIINEKLLDGRFYHTYLKPEIENIIQPIVQASTIEKKYFETFLSFTAKEQFLAKTGDNNPDSNRGFSNVWNLDTETKMLSGDILIDLQLIPQNSSLEDNEGVDRICLKYTHTLDNVLPNFRIGDAVILYERCDRTDNATNKQIFRGSIEEMDDIHLIIKLLNRQKNLSVFHFGGLYALEHDSMDATFTHCYQGLHCFLTSPKERRDLLLGIRSPQINKSKQLHTSPPNPALQEIVCKASQAEDYFLLIGPPGTGKTSMALRAMVEEFIAENQSLSTQKNLLLLAYTNRAVDEICETLERITPSPPYLRIGNELSCAPQYQHRLFDNAAQTCRTLRATQTLIQQTTIWVSTVSSMNGKTDLLAYKHFDTAILDEASQVLEPQILKILCSSNEKECYIRKFILIGDHKQLPAVVLQPTDTSAIIPSELHITGLTNCRNSLFERLLANAITNKWTHAYGMLHKQGRMHEEICAFVNDFFYAKNLSSIPLPHQTGPLTWNKLSPPNSWEQFVASTRLGFLSVTSSGLVENNKSNYEEAQCIAWLVECFIHLHQHENEAFDANKEIGIIVPFRNQITTIRNAIAARQLPSTSEITIDTVECYQGSQRNIILFSTTIHQKYQLNILSNIQQIEDVSVDRKLNVALTRARKQLFIIGNKTLLSRNELYNKLLSRCRHFSYDQTQPGTSASSL